MKQETLEEFAERIAKAFDIDNYKPIMELIIEGAKWQQEQMEKLKDFDTWKEWKNTGIIKIK